MSHVSTDGIPKFELRARGLGQGRLGMEIWQVPSPSTPRLKSPERTAALKGRALEIVETRVLKRLKGTGIRLPDLGKGEVHVCDLPEDLALTLALMFRTLAPMSNLDRIRIVSAGIEDMDREEAGYWLGMAIHRSRPRRVLAALRLLLNAN